MQEALESALADLSLGPPIAAEDAAGIAAWLARHQVAAADARALTRDFSRLLIYRELVRGTLREALRATIPRTLARLDSNFEPYFAEFLRVSPPVTHYLRDLTPQFLRFALERWSSDPNVPAYLSELARHEALQVEIASLLALPKDHVPAELALDQGVEFIDAVRLVHYTWSVHRLPEDESSRVLPERSEVSLLVYRSPEHDVRYLELGQFAQALLSALLIEQCSLQLSLARAAESLGLPLGDELLTRAARLLADLAERGALLGKNRPRSSAAANLLPKTGNPA
ncbi:MAG TPA: putative DNA-binding domain-containing protein [Polyangiaceae bacterium]|nr:putative DNA-binding domain-containing protein [Polyangiaceae bacterium]